VNAMLASGTGTHGLKLTPQDQYVRFVAARSLEFFGTNALTCLPTVIAATHDSEPMVQNVALRIMEKVQRDAPSKK